MQDPMAASPRVCPYIAAGILSATLLAIGTIVDWRPITPIGAGVIARTCMQLGSLGLVATAILLLLFLRSADAPKNFLIVAAKVLGLVLIMFFLGEAFMRLVYYDGMSFSSHFGPIVSRFEREFRFNRYDGPSRGPEIQGPRGQSEMRILFQGDSVTWGQGVKDEGLLYTNRLLEKLRSGELDVEAAVLAEPGRELDGHLAQLRKWGAEIKPDIIIYQWTINDIELNKINRPNPRYFWHYFFFHPPLLRVSYLWFLLDYRLSLIFRSTTQSYQDYMQEYYGAGTEGWAVFSELFRIWAAEAKRLARTVIVVLYPEDPYPNFHSQMTNLCYEEGIVTVDLFPRIKERFLDTGVTVYATRFDAHPNALVHDLMAEVIYGQIKILWPELFTRILSQISDIGTDEHPVAQLSAQVALTAG